MKIIKQFQKEFTKKDGRWMITISSIFFLIIIELIKLVLLLEEIIEIEKKSIAKLLLLTGGIGPFLIGILFTGGILIWLWCEE